MVEWGGTEPLTVPRHTDVRDVRSYIRAPGIAAKAGGLGGSPRRSSAPPHGSALRPSEASRRKSRFTVVAEARVPEAPAAPSRGHDVYGLTALLIIRGAEALLAGEARGTGVLAPAEAFDARTFAGRLEPYLRIVE